MDIWSGGGVPILLQPYAIMLRFNKNSDKVHP